MTQGKGRPHWDYNEDEMGEDYARYQVEGLKEIVSNLKGVPDLKKAELMAMESALDEMKVLIESADRLIAKWKEEDKRYEKTLSKEG